MMGRSARRARRSRVPTVDCGTRKRAAISSYDSPSTCRSQKASRRQKVSRSSAATTSPSVTTSSTDGPRGSSAAAVPIACSRPISRTAVRCRHWSVNRFRRIRVSQAAALVPARN
jgi:hypothetical protein